MRLTARSSDYRTPPWGVTDQPPFVNAVIAVTTSLSPHELLARAEKCERALGRDRTLERRWGPRSIDIDLLAYDDLVLNDPDLILPHPHLFERAFVLVPLAEIAPERVIAGVRVRDGAGTPGHERHRKAAAARLASGVATQICLGWPTSRLDFAGKLVGLHRPAWHFATMTDPETLPLAADFPSATREDWRKLVDAVLKGAPFERLVSTTYDGLRIEPLAARRTDARPIAARAGATAWEVLARIDHPDPALANEIALRELENGASGLSLVFAGAVGDYGFGLPAREDALARVLEGIDLTAGVAIELDLSPPAEAAIDAALAKGLALSPRATRIRLGHDPLGAMAIAGSAARKWNEEAPHFARRLAALAREGFHGKLAAADGRVIHNAGGSEAQELAFVLGVALAYLRALETEGVALETARRMIFFRLCADADQFLTIAKFRALRKLWARVEASCGLAPEPAFVSAETAWRMMAQRDPHVNILRATIAVFAAALGGADAITVLPFTAARGLPDRFARRIARNTQLILIEEAHLANVADPAAGSGAVEDLTDQLCRTAWALFREIEAAGGIAAALESGTHPG